MYFLWFSQIIEFCDSRLGIDVEELIQTVEEVFPATSTEPGNEETINEAADTNENKGDIEERVDMDQQETADGELLVTS